jgi:hypothetical protein
VIERIKSSRAWLFLANGKNRAVLGIAVLVISTVTGGGWKFFTWFRDQGQHAQQTITAINGGIAAGRDIAGTVTVNIGPDEKQLREAVSKEQRPVVDEIAQMEAFCKQTIASLQLGGNNTSSSSVSGDKSAGSVAVATVAINAPAGIVNDALAHPPAIFGVAAIDPLHPFGTTAAIATDAAGMFHVADISVIGAGALHVSDALDGSSSGIVGDALVHPSAAFGAAAIDPLHPFGTSDTLATTAIFQVADVSNEAALYLSNTLGVTSSSVVSDALLHAPAAFGPTGIDPLRPLGTSDALGVTTFGTTGIDPLRPLGTSDAIATDVAGMFHVADISVIGAGALHVSDALDGSSSGIVSDALHPPATFGAAAIDPLHPISTIDAAGGSSGIVSDALFHPPAAFGAAAIDPLHPFGTIDRP